MAVRASGTSEAALDDRPALLLAIRRPAPADWIEPLDSRPFWTGEPSDVVTAIGDRVKWFRPPDVSERLRIQRGSFLLGRFADPAASTTLPLVHISEKPWLSKRMEGLGKPGQPVKADSDVVAFRIRAALKPLLRDWLSDRAGLSQQVIYPTPWHRPYLDQVYQAYGRARPVETEVDEESRACRGRREAAPVDRSTTNFPPFGLLPMRLGTAGRTDDALLLPPGCERLPSRG